MVRGRGGGGRGRRGTDAVGGGGGGQRQEEWSVEEGLGAEVEGGIPIVYTGRSVAGSGVGLCLHLLVIGSGWSL